MRPDDVRYKTRDFSDLRANRTRTGMARIRRPNPWASLPWATLYQAADLRRSSDFGTNGSQVRRFNQLLIRPTSSALTVLFVRLHDRLNPFLDIVLQK